MRNEKGKKTDPHPLGSFYTPTQTVDVKTDAGFAGIVDANLVAFLRGKHGSKSGCKRESRSR